MARPASGIQGKPCSARAFRSVDFPEPGPPEMINRLFMNNLPFRNDYYKFRFFFRIALRDGENAIVGLQLEDDFGGGAVFLIYVSVVKGLANCMVGVKVAINIFNYNGKSNFILVRRFAH